MLANKRNSRPNVTTAFGLQISLASSSRSLSATVRPVILNNLNPHTVERRWKSDSRFTPAYHHRVMDVLTSPTHSLFITRDSFVPVYLTAGLPQMLIIAALWSIFSKRFGKFYWWRVSQFIVCSSFSIPVLNLISISLSFFLVAQVYRDSPRTPNSWFR